MGSFSKDFEFLTIEQLRQMTKDYETTKQIIAKQQEIIQVFKTKYPTTKIDSGLDEFDLDKFIKEI